MLSCGTSLPYIKQASYYINIRNVNNVEHMEIVNTSAEGASLFCA